MNMNRERRAPEVDKQAVAGSPSLSVQKFVLITVYTLLLLVCSGSLSGCHKKHKAPQRKFFHMHDRFIKQAKAEKINLLFIGDSITEYWLSDGKSVWQREFAPLQAANFGIAGDTTQGVLWRLGNGGELNGINPNPKAVVLLIGTNDISNALEPPAKIAQNVSEIVQTIRSKLPQSKVILLGILPRGQLAADPVRETVRQVNLELAKLQDGKEIIYLDIGKDFLDTQGNISKEVMPDYVHLSAKGYEIWAGAIKQTIKKIVE